MNIFSRINAVMGEVSYVQKDSVISGGGGSSYKAVSHDQVVSMVRAAMVKHGIICYPEQVAGEMLIMRGGEVKMHLYSGQYRIHFVGLDGDEIVSVVHAHANDNGDKAPGKALTYAVKSAMLKVFNLETGVDDESREEQRETLKPITDENIAALRKLIKDTDTEENAFCKFLKVGSISEMFNSNFSAAEGLLIAKQKKIKEANDANTQGN